MLEAIHYVRKAIIAKLNGNVTIDGSSVPIYGRVPTNASLSVYKSLFAI